jgi:hypothetical protein
LNTQAIYAGSFCNSITWIALPWRDLFGPSLTLLKILFYPAVRAYRYDRRFVLFPVTMFVKSFQFVGHHLQQFAVRYRKTRRERS